MAGGKRPNILLILTDQQRFDTLRAHGNPLIKTPALDSLSERSLSFTRGYTPTPVCVAARSALITGQPAHRTGCVHNGAMQRRRSLMEYLGEDGYQTHGVGKMHFTFPDRRELWGFESRDFSEEGAGAPGDDFRRSLREAGFDHVFDANGVRSEMYYIPQTSQMPAHLHNSAWVIDRSLDFLERRDEERPFFLFTSFIKPHPPFEVPTPWNKLYRGPQMPLPKRPEGWEHLVGYWNHHQNRYKYRDQGKDDQLIRLIRAYYYASISFIDYQLARLFDDLERRGIFDETLILFTSDHGEFLGDYGSFGKRSFLDSAARVPFLCHFPGAGPTGSCDTPVSLLDILPTCLQAAEIETPDDVPGSSLLDIAEGRAERDVVFGQFEAREKGMYMAVSREWKYIYSAPDNREWLFDLTVDPEETRNRAENPLYTNVARAYRERLISYFKAEGYLDPIDGDGWRVYPRLEVSRDPDAELLFQDPPESLPAGFAGYTSAD